MNSIRITILVENLARGRAIIGEHGLSFHIALGDSNILFDTGQGMALSHNAKTLGIDLRALDAVVLSHGHYDHTGGFSQIPMHTDPLPVFVHPAAFETKFSRHADGTVHDIGLPKDSRKALTAKTVSISETRTPTEVSEQILATGEIPRRTDYEDVGGAFFTDEACTQPDPLSDDLALAIKTPQGLVVLLGCAHAGVVNTMDYITELLGEKHIHAVIGGMHLLHASEDRVRATITALELYDVRFIAPCHCTGDAATASLRKHFSSRFHACSAGTVFEFS